jgi:hypothetical protein
MSHVASTRVDVGDAVGEGAGDGLAVGAVVGLGVASGEVPGVAVAAWVDPGVAVAASGLWLARGARAHALKTTKAIAARTRDGWELTL